MEPVASAETKGENENTTPETEAPQAQGKEDAVLGPEEKVTTGQAPVLNGQEHEVDVGPTGAETPTPDVKEGTDKEGEAPHPVSPKLEEANPPNEEELPKGDILSESATALPETPVPSPEVTGPSCSAATEPARETPKARPSPSNQPEPPDFYCVKWINWKGERTPVITQSENGPCPLLAIVNILFLQWKVRETLYVGVCGREAPATCSCTGSNCSH